MGFSIYDTLTRRDASASVIKELAETLSRDVYPICILSSSSCKCIYELHT